MKKNSTTSASATALRRQAEVRMRKMGKVHSSKAGKSRESINAERLPHELQVYQVELEMQNAALQEARNRMEAQLEKYTELYDFAPVGYFSLDKQGSILEVNLTGGALLGVERSRLIGRSFPLFVASASQPTFRAFLERVFAGNGKHVCEAALLTKGAAPFWASFHAASAISLDSSQRLVRLAVSDITFIKRSEKAQQRMEALAAVNRNLKREIIRRELVEESLRQSEQHQTQLLEQSRQMQEELRRLSRQVLGAQEEERKRISRELHDVIAQTLTGINVRLANLKKESHSDRRGLQRNIARTQQLVEHAVDIVHRFARELRPTVLDDLGLIPALRTYMKIFHEQTGVHVSLSAFAAIERVNGDKRTVLFRVAQEALTNVARHSHATRAELKIHHTNGSVCMKIIDNGKGFRQKLMSNSNKGDRLGLLGMRERLEMVGGKFTITSAPGRGTTVVARIPMSELSRPDKIPADRVR
jgi:PAS domain S-box-containing protein